MSSAPSSTPSTKPRQRRIRNPLRDAPPQSRDAKRLAAAILEVLAGVRTPAEAAQALSIPLPRYYHLEVRGLHGLVAACEPRPRGPRRSPARAEDRLKKECERLRHECQRQHALARAAQRTIGLAPPPASTASQGKKKRRRRVVRALQTVAQLRQDEAATPIVNVTPQP
jgi:hypothetical protein